MPDGVRGLDPERGEGEALEDARMVRSVGRRLVAWAAGKTFLALIVLAVAPYVSVSGTLEASGLSQLDQRVETIRRAAQDPGPGRPRPRPGQDSLPTGYLFGSSTFALILGDDGT